MVGTADTGQVPNEYQDALAKIGFRLEGQLGTGLSGRVVKAWQPRLERHVAVKFCDSSTSISSKSLRLRFEREARLLAALQHPSIPYVLTTGRTSEGVLFTVMQFIEGPSLRQLLDEKGPFDPRMAARYTLEILGALAAAHAAGILHRDVKPDNVLMSPARCVLIDFSIGVDPKARSDHPTATSTGDGLGSIDYMSPEQGVDLKSVDERGDIYSLGVVLFEMLTGHPKIRLDRVDAALPLVSMGLRDVVKTACAESRDQRYSSAEEFLSAVRPFATGSPARLPQAALCISTKCPDANWTSRGYYRGPRLVAEATESHCGSCGQLLVYACSRCSAPFDDARFCGNCGQEWYSLPECKTCGSWLKREDMDSDTEQNCCTKGRRRGAVAQEWGSEVPF